jgi:hypothetical protein
VLPMPLSCQKRADPCFKMQPDLEGGVAEAKELGTYLQHGIIFMMTDDFNFDSHKQWDFFMHGILIFWDPLVGIAANHWISSYTPPSKIQGPWLNLMNISSIFPPVFLRREVYAGTSYTTQELKEAGADEIRVVSVWVLT